MNLHKILKIIAALIGLAGIVFLVRIIAEGDDEIKAAALNGDTSIVDPMAYAAYIILGLVLLFVVIFVLKNLFTNTASLKSTLIGIAAFAAVLVVAYVLAGGDEMAYKLQDGMASDTQSHMVGAGLIAFYILIGLAAISMLFSGAKKITNR